MFRVNRWLRLGRQGMFALLGVLLVVGHVAAQSTCPTMVDEALKGLDTACAGLSRNQACYGNVSLEATPRTGVNNFSFHKIGDIVDVTDIDTLKLEPMDEAANTWGVVMMALQADIPDSLPGQNVTFVLFGNVEIQNTSTGDQTPMQAFTLKTGVSDAGCEEAPESGVMIQTPTGVQSVSFNVNGVDMEVGSTIMLQAQPEKDLIVSTMEGAAVMQMPDGTAYPVICGTEFSIPMDAKMQPRGIPLMPIALRTSRIGNSQLVTQMLPRPLKTIETISSAKMILLEARLKAGLPACGVGELPDCVHALRDHGTRIWANIDAFATPLPLPLSTEDGSGSGGLGKPPLDTGQPAVPTPGRPTRP